MGQRQFASRGQGLEINTDARHLNREFRHGKGEDEPARAIDLEVSAYVFDVIAVAAGEVEAAPHAGVDLHADHLPRRRGEQEFARPVRIQPGIEDPLDREIESPRDVIFGGLSVVILVFLSSGVVGQGRHLRL